jgi:hypothetical protein
VSIYLGKHLVSREMLIAFQEPYIDRELLRKNRKLTHEERIQQLQKQCNAFEERCEAGRWSKEYTAANTSVPYVPAGLTPEEFERPRLGC